MQLQGVMMRKIYVVTLPSKALHEHINKGARICDTQLIVTVQDLTGNLDNH